MATFKVNWRNPIYRDGEINATEVQITDENRTIITVKINKDVYNKSDETLVDLALEQFYQDVFPNRAENEKFAELDNKLNSADEKLKLVDENLKAIEKVKTELETTQGALMELITQISETTELHEEDTHDDKEKVETTENTLEGGE